MGNIVGLKSNHTSFESDINGNLHAVAEVILLVNEYEYKGNEPEINSETGRAIMSVRRAPNVKACRFSADASGLRVLIGALNEILEATESRQSAFNKLLKQTTAE